MIGVLISSVAVAATYTALAVVFFTEHRHWRLGGR